MTCIWQRGTVVYISCIHTFFSPSFETLLQKQMETMFQEEKNVSFPFLLSSPSLISGVWNRSSPANSLPSFLMGNPVLLCICFQLHKQRLKNINYPKEVFHTLLTVFLEPAEWKLPLFYFLFQINITLPLYEWKKIEMERLKTGSHLKYFFWFWWKRSVIFFKDCHYVVYI